MNDITLSNILNEIIKNEFSINGIAIDMFYEHFSIVCSLITTIICGFLCTKTRKAKSMVNFIVIFAMFGIIGAILIFYEYINNHKYICFICIFILLICHILYKQYNKNKVIPENTVFTDKNNKNKEVKNNKKD